MTQRTRVGEGAGPGTGRPVLVREPGAVEGPPGGALKNLWLSGFWAGASSVAPDRVRRCDACAEPFVAADRRERYCCARCRNRVMKRRYRARLRADSTGGESP